MAEKVVGSSTRAAKRGGARDHGISTKICDGLDRLASGKAALCGALAGLGTEN